MELPKINIYERLRDFNVPAAVLDEIFGNEEDLEKLIDCLESIKIRWIF